MGLFNFLFRRRIDRADRLLDYGIFLRNLNKRVAKFGATEELPLRAKMAVLLVHGAWFARQSAGFGDVTLDTDLREAAALVLVQQQGIHTLLSLQHGEGHEKRPEVRAEFASIYSFVTAQTFSFDYQDPSDSALAMLSFATSCVKQAQRDNIPVLQEAFDAWDAFLSEDEQASQLGRAYSSALTWVRTL